MKKKYFKNAMGLTALNVGVATGMSLVSDPTAKAGLGKISSATKPIGTVMGASMVLDELSRLKKKAYKKTY